MVALLRPTVTIRWLNAAIDVTSFKEIVRGLGREDRYSLYVFERACFSTKVL